jgi:hypothetical protein
VANQLRRARVDIPRVEGVKDPAARESLAEVWKYLQRIQANHDTLQAAHDALSASVGDLSTRTDIVARAAQLANAQRAAAIASPAPPPTPTNDGGQGDQGCATAGVNGHITAGTTLSLVVAGQVICGTGNEFPALLAVTVDQATRDANRDELLNRMCWHMNLAGFPCGRYPTTNGHPWILLFDFQSTQYAYRVVSYDEFDSPMTTVMVYGGQTPGATTTVDGGTPD